MGRLRIRCDARIPHVIFGIDTVQRAEALPEVCLEILFAHRCAVSKNDSLTDKHFTLTIVLLCKPLQGSRNDAVGTILSNVVSHQNTELIASQRRLGSNTWKVAFRHESPEVIGNLFGFKCGGTHDIRVELQH